MTTDRTLDDILNDAESALRGLFGWLQATQAAGEAAATTGDPSAMPDMDKILAEYSTRSAQMKSLCAELSVARATATGEAVGEAALVEYLLAVSSESTPAPTASDIIDNLPVDAACIARWVIDADATQLVFGCINMAEAAAGATVASDYVSRISQQHPHPLVRAHAEFFLESGRLTAEPSETFAEDMAELANRLYADYPAALERAMAAFSAGVDPAQANHLAEVLPLGESAPDFDLELLGGGRVTLGDFAGRPVVLQFTASWCGPCQHELPVVQDIYARYHDRGLEILGIAMDDDPEALTEYVESKGIPWKMATAFFGDQFHISYPVLGVPSFVILDGAGKVAAVDLRPSLQGVLFEGVLEELLGGSAA